MKSFPVAVFCLILLFFSFVTPLYAQEREPFVINGENVKNQKELDRNINASSFIVLQIPPSMMNRELAQKLLTRVKNGGVLWFYDSSIAPFWGWKDSPMVIPNLKQEELNAEFGTGKVSGSAVGAEAVKGSSVTLGVRRLVVFVPRAGKNSYSAVAHGENIIPLLRVPRQKALIAAMEKVGSGYIVFKPLLWEKHYDGSVFQRRLLNFSKKKSI